MRHHFTPPPPAEIDQNVPDTVRGRRRDGVRLRRRRKQHHQ